MISSTGAHRTGEDCPALFWYETQPDKAANIRFRWFNLRPLVFVVISSQIVISESGNTSCCESSTASP